MSIQGASQAESYGWKANPEALVMVQPMAIRDAGELYWSAAKSRVVVSRCQGSNMFWRSFDGQINLHNRKSSILMPATETVIQPSRRMTARVGAKSVRRWGCLMDDLPRKKRRH